MKRDAYFTSAAEEQSRAAKTNFLARMSHEMRTPLNAIIGMTTIAQTSHEPEKIAYCLSKISEASLHLLGLINDILDMSQIEAGEFVLVNEEFCLEKMIRSAVSMTQFGINEKRQQFSLELGPGLPEFVIADEQHLGQILTNLLSNAVKFTPSEGKITLAVEKLRESEGVCTLRMTVKDTGIGIPEDQREKLYALFEQADGGMARKYDGTGLGLTIVKSMLDLMGGEIRVESSPGKGSAFIVEFGVEQLKEPEPEEPSAKAGPAETAPRYAGRCILMAEDVEINREIIISLLEDTGLVIECAENGAEAVKLFETAPSKYDLILMDIHMPEMDGYEAARRIRACPVPEAVRIPIIAVTANVFQEDVNKCIQAGMNDHLGKPVDYNELMKRIDKYLPDEPRPQPESWKKQAAGSSGSSPTSAGVNTSSCR
jgi:CheY-like chemotaxis protein